MSIRGLIASTLAGLASTSATLAVAPAAPARGTALPVPPIIPAQSTPIRTAAQAPQNSAGVVFHPFGDYFEIWDNVRDRIPVQVWYRYANSRHWHRIVSRVHYARYRRNVAEFPNQIVFLIDGHNRQHRFVRAAQSRYRTWGT